MQQRWQYNWIAAPPFSAWTMAEQRDFHDRADRNIWAAWSNRAKLSVSGTSAFATKFKGKALPINLDIRRVTATPHWKVNVTKIATGTFQTSSVEWTARQIHLDTNDFVTRVICLGTPAVCTRQVPVAHEFGHAAGNTAVLLRGDEYHATSPHAGDQASIMHSGNLLRARHFQTILDELNKMIPSTTFAVLSV
jgi:hypothetical protein